mgnify:CR=1 FL=1
MACSAFSGGHAVLAMVLSAEGGCQCGAVCYKVTAAPVVVYACHCTVCQTQSGSAFGLAARFNSDDVELVKGSLASFERPGSGGFFFTNSFCGQCGTRIHHVSSRFPHLASLKPGTLDDTSWLKPTFQIFIVVHSLGLKLLRTCHLSIRCRLISAFSLVGTRVIEACCRPTRAVPCSSTSGPLSGATSAETCLDRRCTA